MKKFAAILLSLLVFAFMGVTAFADLGAPEFDDWYVVCGVDGYDYESTEQDNKYTEHIEPGVKYQVYYYNETNGTYMLLVNDDQYNGKSGMIDIKESDLNNKFMEAKKTVAKESGTKLGTEVKSKVTSDIGIVLRQGPATTFKSYLTIPKGATIDYQYTHSYGGHNWGYVTYNGKSGWTCIDYTEEITTTTTATTTTKAEEQTEDVLLDKAEASTQEDEEMSESSGFFSNTKTVIVICCLGAIVVALTAVVVILIIQKKNKI